MSCNPFSSDSIDFNENNIASIAELMLTLGVKPAHSGRCNIDGSNMDVL